MSHSLWVEQLQAARAGDAPRTTMRLAHWVQMRSAPRLRRVPERWVALFAADAEPGAKALVVLVVREDPAIDEVPQGAEVDVWGWPEAGGGVHIAHGELAITAAGPCDVFMLRRMPRL